MGDPTLITGIVVVKLVDWVIEETKTAIECTENCRALNERLKDIRPLVYSVARDLSADGDGMVVAGFGPVRKWLEDLENLLREAGALVLKCKKTVKAWNLMRRNELSKQILNIKQKIEDICTAEATLASLKIEVGTARGVDETLKVLAKLPLNVGNAIEEVFQPYRKEAELAFREIKEKLAILVTRVSDQTSTSQLTEHEAEIRPVTEQSFGVDAPLEKLRDLLFHENKITKYVGVCGTGGIGKTRLAELAYNSNDVQDHFDRRIWLTVGNDATIEGLLQQLCEKLKVTTKNLQPSDMKTNLFNALRGMRVLLVLDDIWDNGDPILEMLNVTSGPDTGSKILVTTRHIRLLEREGAYDQTVMMKGLSPDDSWALFCEFAFRGVDTFPKEMERLAKEVAAECKGLPLALKVVARALAGKKVSQQWERALKMLVEAKVLDKSQETQLYKVLQLSYDELEFVENDKDHPHRLQKCFIYFASFPEDSAVSSEKLVSLWAGEKLLEAGDEINHGYWSLRELIDRSLIENLSEEKRSRTSSDNVNSGPLQCRVHDVLRDFARHLIREKRAPMKCLFSPGKGLEKFPDEWLETTLPSGLVSDATHLSLNNNCLQSLSDELKLPKLEVLLLANNRSDDPLIISPGFVENLSSLKVLDLEYTWIPSLPENLGNLTNLTYLELSNTQLRELPRGVCNLSKLEYLGLFGARLMSLPNLFELQKLQKLDLGDCHFLKQLPAQFASKGAFPALKELSMDFCDALEEFPPTEEGAFPKLEKLSMKSCGSLKQLGAGFAAKGVFPALKKLYLDSCDTLEEFPPTKERAFPKLETLSMCYCKSLKQLGDDFTSKGVFPALKNLYLNWYEALEVFPPTKEGAFPKLETLSINSCDSLKQLGEGFALKGVFPALKNLYLNHCEALKEFPPTKEGAFPMLEELEMVGCRSLKELGEGFGSKGVFPALKKLNLNRCEALEEFPPTKDGAFPKLEKLSMKSCESLRQIGEGFSSKGVFPALKKLNLDRLKALKEFPPTKEGSFPKLETLSMKSCESLRQLGKGFASKGVFPALKGLYLDGCEALEDFPPTTEGAFPALEIFSMKKCRCLKQLGAEFACQGVFPVLQKLDLEGCEALEEFPPAKDGAFPKLEKLSMNSCESLKQLGEGFASKGVFPALKNLCLDSCGALEEFPPTEEGAFPKLERLSMNDCKTLKDLGEGFASKGGFESLEKLSMNRCVALKKFPSSQKGAFPKLEQLSMIYCKSLKQLGERFASNGVFPSLEKLNLNGCEALEEFPPTKEGAFPELQSLSMKSCESLKQLGEGFASKGVFPVLQMLYLDNCEALEQFPPIEEGAFPALKNLYLVNCRALEEFPPTKEGAFPELTILSMRRCESLRQLGEGFASKGVFPALKKLTLDWCKALEEFPPTEEGAFPELEFLSLKNCESLKQLGEGFTSKGVFPALKKLDRDNYEAFKDFPH